MQHIEVSIWTNTNMPTYFWSGLNYDNFHLAWYYDSD